MKYMLKMWKINCPDLLDLSSFPLEFIILFSLLSLPICGLIKVYIFYTLCLEINLKLFYAN